MDTVRHIIYLRVQSLYTCLLIMQNGGFYSTKLHPLIQFELSHFNNIFTELFKYYSDLSYYEIYLDNLNYFNLVHYVFVLLLVYIEIFDIDKSHIAFM